MHDDDGLDTQDDGSVLKDLSFHGQLWWEFLQNSKTTFPFKLTLSVGPNLVTGFVSSRRYFDAEIVVASEEVATTDVLVAQLMDTNAMQADKVEALFRRQLETDGRSEDPPLTLDEIETNAADAEIVLRDAIIYRPNGTELKLSYWFGRVSAVESWGVVFLRRAAIAGESGVPS